MVVIGFLVSFINQEKCMFAVVYNACYGGFSLSEEACEYLNEKYDLDIDVRFGFTDLPRHDKRLVEVVELMGDKSSGSCAKLRIDYIHSNIYMIDEYDGFESVVIPEDQKWVAITEDCN